MEDFEIRIFDVIDNTDLPPLIAESPPQEGDPVEINHEMYYICEINNDKSGEISSIGVIPLVVKNPKKVLNINSYINCLSIAHKKIQFRKKNKSCEFDECDEMLIS